MKTDVIEVFFSCSFHPDDRPVNDLVKAICNGLGISCINVSFGSTRVPPAEARKLIENAYALIAVAVRRDRADDGSYIMPAAVREEIAMAYGIGKPILLLSENGVRIEGFSGNVGTYLMFDRAQLGDISFMEKLVKSCDELRQEIVASHANILEQDTQGVVSERKTALIELVSSDDGFFWRHTTTKHVRFTKLFRRPIRTGWWSSVPTRIPASGQSPEWEVLVDNGSKNFTIESELVQLKSDCVEASLTVKPAPELGDFLQYTTVCTSQLINPVYAEDIASPAPLEVDGSFYQAYDGLLPTDPTKYLKVQFRFPREYGLTKEMLTPIVAVHSHMLDYALDREFWGMDFEIEPFGGNITVTVSAENPVLRHMYGIAWNPPKRPTR